MAICWLITFAMSAQPVYEMQNATVFECEGILTDSNNGPEENQYNHNEIYTFTICVEQASEILLAFHFFATEEGYDFLTVYDGPNTSSPVLAVLTGSLQPPPVLVATSGCATLHFTSDANIVAIGWELDWSVVIEEPTPPVISVVTPLDCPMDAITFSMNFPVDCDLLTSDHFTVIGPGSPGISQVNSLDCNPGPQGSLFQVVFDPPLTRPGTYRLIFNGAIQDACGEWHDITSNVPFALSNCPFDVEINLVTHGCADACGSVTAEIIGDAGVAYLFQWSHTASPSQTVNICSAAMTTISVTVTDPVSMVQATAQYEYTPLPVPVILNPIQDTICASQGDHFYQSSIPGGNYYSNIIPENLQSVGRYQFWRWASGNNLHTDIVTYVAPNGCQTYDTVYVWPINVGNNDAACLNASPFTVTSGTPAGGVWSGPHINPNGLFTPAATGSFLVTYTAPNGCSASKRIFVTDAITMPQVDTICSSQEIDLTALPDGGRWSGPGIVNAVVGRLRPWTVAPNQTYQYVYSLNGCSDTINIYIQEIWAGPDQNLCIQDSLLYLDYEGIWSGPGIYLPEENAFDISALSPGEYVYTLSAYGCTDAFRLYLHSPYVDPYEPISLCLEDAWIPLSDYVDFRPNWGDFSGPAVVEYQDIWYFNPMNAGPGNHTIFFEAVGCRDSFMLYVEPEAIIPEYSFCELSTAQILSAIPSGGTWSGPGFIDDQIGLFDPQLLPPGDYEVIYTAPSGCTTSAIIEIIIRQQARINGVSQIYCFNDVLINVDITPGDGDFYINGELSPPQFNPAVLGEGTHELFYRRGSGPCGSSHRVFFSVLAPISGITSLPDSICQGENAVVDVAISGGTGTLTSTWDQGLGFGASHIVNPATTTLYTVTVTDGCSEPFTGTSLIYVYQPFDVDIISGPPVCYDQISTIEILPPSDQYAVYWLLDTLYESTLLENRPGLYRAEVVELFSGCEQTYEVVIPGPPPLRANFATIPNQPCIDIIQNRIEIIDLATGYTGGWIDFGDGTPPQAYVSGIRYEHEYTALGEYLITLIVTNDLDCVDSFSRSICIENIVAIYIPNIFSPNGDGVNDAVEVTAYGLSTYSWAVFTRYGEKVFETNDPDAVWDGTHRGKALDPGVFVVHLQYVNLESGAEGQIVRDVTLVR
jgi:gliding motility-associated-like protein